MVIPKVYFLTIKGWTYFINPPKVLVFPYVGIFQVVQKWPFMAELIDLIVPSALKEIMTLKNKFKS